MQFNHGLFTIHGIEKTKSTVVRLHRLRRQMEGPEPYLLVSFTDGDLRRPHPLGMLLHIAVLHLRWWQAREASPLAICDARASLRWRG
jgi:hypothetical protein